MAGAAVEKDASYFGPMAMATPTDGTLATNTIRRATSSTNTSEALNSDTMQDGAVKVVWAGKFVDVTNEDLVNPLDFAFSVAAQTLVYGKAGTFAVGDAESGERIFPGQTKSYIVPPGAGFANWIQPAGAAAATIAFRLSEGNVGTR
jgi:hypothetical protein